MYPCVYLDPILCVCVCVYSTHVYEQDVLPCMLIYIHVVYIRPWMLMYCHEVSSIMQEERA